MSEMETFEIDTELTRDAIYAGIWCHLCNAIRGGRDDGYRVHEYIDSFLEGRGDPLADLLTFLDEDISSLQDARRRITAVQETPLGAKVELDGVRRFMPKARAEKTGRWLYTDVEIRETKSTGDQVLTVRDFGSDERLRGQ